MNHLGNVVFLPPSDVKLGKISVLRQGLSWVEPPQKKTADGKSALRFAHTQYPAVDGRQWRIYRSNVSHQRKHIRGVRNQSGEGLWHGFNREEIQITFRCGSTWLRQEASCYFTSNEAALFFPVEVNLPLLLPKHSCQQSLLWTNSSGWMRLHVNNPKRTWKTRVKSGLNRVSCKLDWKELTTIQAKYLDMLHIQTFPWIWSLEVQ